MIRTTLILLVILLMTCLNTRTEAIDTTSVNIRALLEKQISEIKKREEAKKNIVHVEPKKQASVVMGVSGNIDASVKEFLSKDVAVKIFIVVEVLMLTGLFLIWSRKMKKNKKRRTAILKSNIKKLREERIGSFEVKKLSLIRNRLCFEPIKINDNGRDITYRARKNNISKGEVHLAARIKLLAGEYK